MTLTVFYNGDHIPLLSCPDIPAVYGLKQPSGRFYYIGESKAVRQRLLNHKHLTEGCSVVILDDGPELINRYERLYLEREYIIIYLRNGHPLVNKEARLDNLQSRTNIRTIGRNQINPRT